MQVKLIHHTPLDACTEAAGVCRNSKDPEKALVHALAAGHDSLLEQWSASFKIEGISRACSHQLVRHRIGFSYAQQSQRHVKVAEGHDWYVTPARATKEYHRYIEAARQGYVACIEAGMSLEDARYLLPNACKTGLVVTANARALHNFFDLRLCSHAQAEIKELAHSMLTLVYQVAPVLFSRKFPDCENCKEKCGKYDIAPSQIREKMK